MLATKMALLTPRSMAFSGDNPRHLSATKRRN
jgi:hypothetical protein